jgi:hypothetical protein
MYIQDNVSNLFGIRLGGATVALYTASSQGTPPLGVPVTPGLVGSTVTDNAGNFVFDALGAFGCDFHLYVTPAGGASIWYYHYQPISAYYPDVAVVAASGNTPATQVSGLITGTTAVGSGATVTGTWVYAGRYDKVTAFCNRATTAFTAQLLGSAAASGANPAPISGLIAGAGGATVAVTSSGIALPYIAVQVKDTGTGTGAAGAYIYLQRGAVGVALG